MESDQSAKIPIDMPPNNPEMEMAVLGCMLKNDKEAAAYIFDTLDQSCFYQLKHRIIFEAGKELFKSNAPTDVTAILDKLKKENKLDDNVNFDYLDELERRIPSASNYEYSCKMVLDAARARKVISLLENFKTKCYDLSTPPDIDDFHKQIDKIALDRAGVGAVPPVADRLRNKQGREKDRDPHELLGYRLNKFCTIGETIDGVQPGFYIFAGITHVGKTAFLTNIFYDLLNSNDDLSGVYFSLDDNENVIINRLLAILCNGAITINALQRRVDNQVDAGKLAAAYDRLAGLAESGRFNIMDFAQVQTVETVERVIRSYIRNEKKLFIVIDGLQNIETGKEYGGLREKNVDLAAIIKRMVDVYQIPILTSVECRKRPAQTRNDLKNLKVMPTIDDIMESGKYGYNASHIWIGHPENDYQNFIDHQKDEYQLTVKTAKSKISGSVGSIEFKIKRSYNKIMMIDEKENDSSDETRDLRDVIPG